jgi:hypothetical protein
MSRNANQKGRRVEKRHVRLYHTETGCSAWQNLSGNAVKLLIAVARLYTGDNNGSIFLSVRDAAREIRVTRNTAARLFSELEAHGFIAATERGHFHVKGGPATCWRLTWHGALGRAPTRDFERWESGKETKSRSPKLCTTVPKIVTVNGNRPKTVPKMVTATTETSHVSTRQPCSKMVTQVVLPETGAEDGENPGWKHDPKSGDVSIDLLDELRDRVADHIKEAGVGAQTRLADAARIPGGTLSKFLTGRGLNRTHFVALQLEVGRVQREAA